jgi:N-acetylmuramoyl-L-alanine amidase
MTNATNIPPKPAARKQKQAPAAADFSFSRTITTILGAGLVIATLFTLWSPNRLFADDLLNELVKSIQSGEAPQTTYASTPDASKPHIGLIAGHWGYNDGMDSGAVCTYGQYEGTTELEVNLRVATLVKNYLQADGYVVDLLEEDDDRLDNYSAVALLSIHADSCEYVNDEATGFKLAGSLTNPYPEKTNRLKACLIHHYGQTTGLPYHIGSSQTLDMLHYHVFDVVNLETPTVILETGFMNLDADKIIRQPEMVASGIADGIRCFVRNEPLPEDTLATAQPQ